MTLQSPNPLSNSAVLALQAPHRFADHVDGIILADKTIIIGPDSAAHIQARTADQQIVLVQRDEGWSAKVSTDANFTSFSETSGGRLKFGLLAMTLEKA